MLSDFEISEDDIVGFLELHSCMDNYDEQNLKDTRKGCSKNIIIFD